MKDKDRKNNLITIDSTKNIDISRNIINIRTLRNIIIWSPCSMYLIFKIDYIIIKT